MMFNTTSWSPTWSKLIEQNDTQINSKIKKHIVAINIALTNYNANYVNKDKTSLEQDLRNIVDACEAFIRFVPLNVRKKSSEDYFKSWSDILSKEWSVLLPILHIQKQATSRLFLPTASNDAQGRWKLLNSFFGASKSKLATKRLEDEYWSEFRFKGQMQIEKWINCNIDKEDRLWSRAEIIENNKDNYTMNQIQYFQNPQDNEVHINNKLLYYKNELLDTQESYGEVSSGFSIFVVSKNNKIYISPPGKKLERDIHHSSFLNGSPVLCAGTLKVIEGQIIKITLTSGHYKPQRLQLLNFLEFLYKNNVDLSIVSVVDKPKGEEYNALTYLKTKGALFCKDQGKFWYQNAQMALLDKEDSLFKDYILLAEQNMGKEKFFQLIVGLIRKGFYFNKEFKEGIKALKIVIESKPNDYIKIYDAYANQIVNCCADLEDLRDAFDIFILLKNSDLFVVEKYDESILNLHKTAKYLIKQMPINKEISLKEEVFLRKLCENVSKIGKGDVNAVEKLEHILQEKKAALSSSAVVEISHSIK